MTGNAYGGGAVAVAAGSTALVAGARACRVVDLTRAPVALLLTVLVVVVAATGDVVDDMGGRRAFAPMLRMENHFHSVAWASLTGSVIVIVHVCR